MSHAAIVAVILLAWGWRRKEEYDPLAFASTVNRPLLPTVRGQARAWCWGGLQTEEGTVSVNGRGMAIKFKRIVSRGKKTAAGMQTQLSILEARAP